MKLLKRVNTVQKKFQFSIFIQDIYLDAERIISDISQIPLIIQWEKKDSQVQTKKPLFIINKQCKIEEKLTLSLTLYLDHKKKYQEKQTNIKFLLKKGTVVKQIGSIKLDVSMYPNNNINNRQETMNITSTVDSKAKINFQITCASVEEQIRSQDELINLQNKQQDLLQQESYEKQQQIVKLKRQLNEQENQKQQQQLQAEQIQQMKETHKKEIQALDNIRQKQAEQINTLQQQKDRQQLVLQQLQENKEGEDQGQNIKLLQFDLEAKNKQIRQMEDKVRQLEGQAEELQEQLKVQKRQLIKHQSEKERAEQELKNNYDLYLRIEGEKDQQLQKNVSQNEKYSELNEQYRMLQIDNQKNKNKIQQLNQDLEELKLSNEQYIQELKKDHENDKKYEQEKQIQQIEQKYKILLHEQQTKSNEQFQQQIQQIKFNYEQQNIEQQQYLEKYKLNLKDNQDDQIQNKELEFQNIQIQYKQEINNLNQQIQKMEKNNLKKIQALQFENDEQKKEIQFLNESMKKKESQQVEFFQQQNLENLQLKNQQSDNKIQQIRKEHSAKIEYYKKQIQFKDDKIQQLNSQIKQAQFLKPQRSSLYELDDDLKQSGCAHQDIEQKVIDQQLEIEDLKKKLSIFKQQQQDSFAQNIQKGQQDINNQSYEKKYRILTEQHKKEELELNRIKVKLNQLEKEREILNDQLMDYKLKNIKEEKSQKLIKELQEKVENNDFVLNKTAQELLQAKQRQGDIINLVAEKGNHTLLDHIMQLLNS